MASFGSWTFAGTGTGALDSSVKHGGNSSYKSYCINLNNSNTLSKNLFTCQNIQVILWARLVASTVYSFANKLIINHPSYGDLTLQSVVNGTVEWEKFKVTFWYDPEANTKFGRIEKWVTDAWVQQGTDTNFGTGEPATANIYLKNLVGNNTTCTVSAWFDEVEAYDVVVG